MNKVSITQRDIFLLSLNRLDEERARQVRLACVHSPKVRSWLVDIASNAEHIYAQAIREHLATLTPARLEESQRKIAQAYSEGRAQDDDFFDDGPAVEKPTETQMSGDLARSSADAINHTDAQ